MGGGAPDDLGGVRLVTTRHTGWTRWVRKSRTISRDLQKRPEHNAIRRDFGSLCRVGLRGEGDARGMRDNPDDAVRGVAQHGGEGPQAARWQQPSRQLLDRRADRRGDLLRSSGGQAQDEQLPAQTRQASQLATADHAVCPGRQRPMEKPAGRSPSGARPTGCGTSLLRRRLCRHGGAVLHRHLCGGPPRVDGWAVSGVADVVPHGCAVGPCGGCVDVVARNSTCV